MQIGTAGYVKLSSTKENILFEPLQRSAQTEQAAVSVV
jgi:hypothetical protein